MRSLLQSFKKLLGLMQSLQRYCIPCFRRDFVAFPVANSLQAHWGIGRLLLKYGQSTEALPFFRKAVKYGKKYRQEQGVSDVALSVMFQDMGVCLGENGLYAQQARAFNRSLGLHYRSNTLDLLMVLMARFWDESLKLSCAPAATVPSRTCSA
jgi:tetratricopeptide (TPR) repeat protein